MFAKCMILFQSFSLNGDFEYILIYRTDYMNLSTMYESKNGKLQNIMQLSGNQLFIQDLPYYW